MEFKNEVILQGVLYNDVVTKTSTAGNDYCIYTILTENTNKKTEKVFKTFHNCVSFGKSADACKGFKNGDFVAISGRIDKSKYTDKEGVEKTSFRIVAHYFKTLNAVNTAPPQSAPEHNKNEELAF